MHRVVTSTILQKKVPDASASVWIHTSGRLIQNDNLWPSNKSKGYWEFPLHTTWGTQQCKCATNQTTNKSTYQKVTHLTTGWSWICVCVEGQYQSRSAPSQPSLPPQTDPSDGHRTRCALLLSTWNTPDQAKVDYYPQNWSIQPWNELIWDFLLNYFTCRSDNDTYMLKRTLCCGHTPRLCLIELSSERMSLPMIYAVPEVGGKRPVKIDLKHWRQIGGFDII